MSESRKANVSEFTRALVRFNAHVLGVTSGLIAGSGLFIATLILVLQGGEQPGIMLGQLRYFFPGYSVSVPGAFLGALWAGVAGYVLGALFALAYSPWLLREAVRVSSRPSDDAVPGDDVALLNPWAVAVATGALLGLGLMAATTWLSLRSGTQNPHLELLANYLPGFDSGITGAAIGAAWLFVYGALAAGCIAWTYNRIVAMRRPQGFDRAPFRVR